MITSEIQKLGIPFRRVFSRKGRNGDYYYMHRMTGSCETVIVEYGFIDNKTDHKMFNTKAKREKFAEAVVMAVCEYIGTFYEPRTKSKWYRVVTGSFSNKENAEERVKVLEKAGFDSFIDINKENN